MMKIYLDAPAKVTEQMIQGMMPVGYMAEASGESGVYLIYPDGYRQVVGRVDVLDTELSVTFGDDPWGEDLARAFGLKHPAHNPLQILYGFVYLPDGSPLWQLDKKPSPNRMEVLGQAGDYDQANEAHFVSFRKGEWDRDVLKVMHKYKVLPGGVLGGNQGEDILSLGSLEHDGSM